MFFNPLYKKFTLIAFSILLVFINGSYNNEVHAQKLNLKQKIASIKWPSILQGKRISLDDTLKQVPKPKVKKTKPQAPAKQPKQFSLRDYPKLDAIVSAMTLTGSLPKALKIAKRKESFA